MLTPRPKANVKHLNYLGVTNREIVRSSREIISASPKKAALIQIHTDSPLKLRIRLLESLPTAEPKLSNEMHIIAHSQCGDWKLSLSPKGNLTSQTNGKSLIEVANAFVHQSRVFYINKYFGNHEILSDNGKFLTSLPASFGHPALPFWQLGDYISYNDVLLFIPSRSIALLISEDFFREYEIIPIVSKALLSDIATLDGTTLDFYYSNFAILNAKSISMFQDELLAITEWGDQFYNGDDWEDFEMDWGGLNRSLYDINLMVVSTKDGEQLFAFSGESRDIR